MQLNRVAAALDDDAWKPIIGAKAKDLAANAVRRETAKSGSLADLSMSGWPRSKPAKLEANWESEGSGITVGPYRRVLGPWRVLEDGRRAYRAGQFRRRGSRGATKYRGATSRLAVVSRTVGSVQGKGTWTKATNEIGRLTPRDITKAKRAAVRKAWG